MQYTIKVPKKINLFVVLTCIVFLTPVFMQITHNNYVKLIEDAVYMIMLLHSVYIMLFHNKIIIEKSRTMLLFILLFIIFTIIGIYYNGLYLVILQFREFKYLLLLIIMIPYTNKEYFKHVWTVLRIISMINVPVAIIQWILYRDIGDYITGILGHGASGTLTLFLLIMFFTELGIRLKEDKPIFGVFFLYLIPTALNETKITIVLFPIMLFLVLFVTKKLKSKQTIIIVTIGIILFFAWAYTYDNIHSHSILDIFTSEYLEEYLYATHWEGDAGRLAKVAYAYEAIKNDNLAFGYGLGSSYYGASSGAKGYILNRYYSPEMFGGTRPQLFLSIIDFGLVGTILIILVIVIYFIRMMRVKENTLDKFISINSFIILFITLLYQNIFYTYPIMYILVFYTITALKNGEMIKKDIKKQMEQN